MIKFVFQAKKPRKCQKFRSYWRGPYNIVQKFSDLNYKIIHVKWVPVTTAWRVLGLRMEERPPGMEGSCEYIE
jgi:hypothetical protein